MINSNFIPHISISAKLIIQKIQELNTTKLPIVIMGDFNMLLDHESIQFLNQYFYDSKSVADISFGPKGTFNGFHFDEPVTKRIDYIFISKIEVKKYVVLSDN